METQHTGDVVNPSRVPAADDPWSTEVVTLSGSARPGRADEELRGTLEAMQSLLQDAVLRHSALRADDHALVTTTDPTCARNTLATALKQATSAVSVILPDAPRPAEVVMEGVERSAVNWSSGIRVRMLAGSGSGSRERMLAYAAGKHWLDVRLTESRFPSTVVVDLRCAMVRVARPDGAWQASMVRDNAIINAVHMMFVGGWHQGVPLLNDVAVVDSPVAHDAVLEIISHLVEGRIDEMAAREMAISVRTYRRYVAVIMRSLGATSRFQAGVLATELGLTGRRGSLPGCVPRTNNGPAATAGADQSRDMTPLPSSAT